ncbi:MULTISPECIES: SMP-30/gluconolactonase/LRE family protein [unclassified Cobetia]|uniref:SMP-30/gluconolactonase/LRE family protein n=1 Tax=unclassified Cobetia TaxID=2609414 RepID=UPI00178CF8EC|nr:MULTISPECIES: SMP-30/gluconolactonase/LRE family protein [unclassified Cobetia]MBE2169115.1 SMP-30/gluconolactonase/LRE family protein [Cobetia sp. 2AS1]MDH2446601.1 SMP-30/gluconolactonase/LRE family protein [Cobetia sp. 2AS]
MTSSPCLGTARRLVASGCELGEGPGWTPATNTLPARVRWLNILAGELHHAAADGSDHVITQLARRTSYAAVTQDGDYLLVAQGMLSRFTPETGAVEDVMPFAAETTPATRSNDARVDRHGSLWLSSMGYNAESGAGSLYRLHRGELTRVLEGLTIPNALCFSPDGRFAYFTDTVTGQVMRWQLDADGWPLTSAGEYNAPEVWADLRDAGGGPDGAVIDADGHMWIALWGASRVARLDHDGKEIAHVALPVSQPSCPLFGGEGLSTLYITTAHEGMTTPDHAAGDGDLFALDLSAHGFEGLAEPPLVLG